MILKTVKIKCDNDLGYRIINLSDFLESVDELYDPRVIFDEPDHHVPVNTKKSRSKKLLSIEEVDTY